MLTLGIIALSFFSCGRDNNVQPQPEQTGNTYVGMSIKFPKNTSLKATSSDYNNAGTWNGRDVINNVTVFLVGKDYMNAQTFDKSAFKNINSQGVLEPNIALKAQAGKEIKAYVLINATTSFINKLKAAGLEGFEKEYSEVEHEFTLNDVAKYDTSTGKDEIMMTNTNEVKILVRDNVTEAEALKPDNPNMFKVNAERIVARAIVTSPQSAQIDKSGVPYVTISKVQYTVGQGNKKVYMLRRTDLQSPGYGYVPTNGDWLNKGKIYYDYSQLNNLIATTTTLVSPTPETIGSLNHGKFLFPVTHPDAEYRKGNTPYIELQATFAPVGNKLENGKAYNPGDDLYMGISDRKFYKTLEDAKVAIPGQKVSTFKKGIMKYVLWLNPDNITNPTISPVVRSNIYHVEVTGFKEVGLSYNPLNPEDPKMPDEPINPIDPEDPLLSSKTYLSVTITTVPWDVHFYKVEVGNGY
ncbi:Mfa1 family fimbria major subunit [Porphyromonas pogonae]